MRELIVARHGHALSNVADVVSSAPPGLGLSEQGIEEALALREALAYETVELGVASRLRRTQETLTLALGERPIPVEIAPGLDEIGFGAYEGGPLAAYRTWAWTMDPDDECPGGGESRVAAALRWAQALEALATRPEDRILAVTHALPLRYLIDASDGVFPAARMEPVPHATPVTFSREAVARAVETMRVWAQAPRFVDAVTDGSGRDLDVTDLDRW